MSVIVVGDRAVGKTTMVYYLADTKEQERIIVKDGPDPMKKDKLSPTEQMEPDKTIKMFVDLPVSREIQVQWTDTPGEAFTLRDALQGDRPVWESIKTKMSNSRYLILLVPPYQEIIKSSLLELDPRKRELNDFLTIEPWQKRMTQWFDLFSQECPKVKHLLICLHQVDLVCSNIKFEADQWRYQTNDYSWDDYSHMVYDRYFSGLSRIISQYEKDNRSQLIHFFMTTIKERALLELPWLCIGTYE